MDEISNNYWKKCSACKAELPFDHIYKVCSVSTCNSKKLGLTFCSVKCWDSHLGFANHRSSWAEERRSPTKSKFLEDQNLNSSHEKKKVFVRPSENLPIVSTGSIETETLVVVSKIKKLIKEQSGMSTSQCAIEAMTEKVVQECLRAIENAKQAERKTVMGRDF